MIKTIFILLTGIISLSFASIFIKLCSDVPAIMIAAYRLGVASVILFIIFKLKGHSLKEVPKKDLLFSLVGGLFLAFHFIAWITSLKYTSVASSVVLVTTNPIFVGLFSYFLFKEKQEIELVIGIVLCLLGSIMIVSGDSGIHELTLYNKKVMAGDVLALIGAIMASGYLIVGSKVREKLDILPYVTVVFTSSAIFLLVISVVMKIPFTGYRSTSYLYMVLLALIPQLIGHTSINWALKNLKTSLIAISILGEPVGATILAYIFFKESVGPLQFIGMSLIFAAIITASRKGKKLKIPA
ncbi:multidrug transporter [Peptococcaceae bacterium SCADC1_2_3]|jgi:drug/metabolite transporter (DMT)-like permease|nr:multidrug transporter [Peptococcaceae bacterium SCADC1_2_3]KFI38156.1 multidrug transporter [Peptococcaceae bacterium SCADC1_2_3]HBQ29166.1 EamA family transporter [Desulfotomaculum sp.]HCJ78691.1 EamA family transporter [Desulfotomaculum sp.]